MEDDKSCMFQNSEVSDEDKFPLNPVIGHFPNRRKLHLDRVDCFSLARTPEGSASLSNPLLNDVRRDRNRQRLLPIYRTRKKMNNFPATDAGGFQSAAEFHRQETCPELPTTKDTATPKKNKKKLITSPNQRSLTSFFKSSKDPSNGENCCKKSVDPHSSESSPEKRSSEMPSASAIYISDTESTSRSPQATRNTEPSCSQNGTPSKMFSPIKLLGKSSTIYITDTDSPTSSQNSDSEQSRKNVDKVNVVKALFEGQKKLANESQQKKRKRNHGKKNVPILPKIPKVNASLHSKDTEEMNSSDDDVLCTAEESTDSKYGLLGHQPAERINYFDKLPDELLQKIFCQLPILDLCLNCNRVCVRWNEVISQEKVKFCNEFRIFCKN
jgi:hypothetical protein